MDRMIGKVPVSIFQDEENIVFTFSDGTSCRFFHEQECSESVTIDDVNGVWDDLLNVPMLVADERRSHLEDIGNDSQTWTFYTFRSIHGSVDVKWYGSSNGYYSECVDFMWVGK